jgi:hypothetical protein
MGVRSTRLCKSPKAIGAVVEVSEVRMAAMPTHNDHPMPAGPHGY